MYPSTLEIETPYGKVFLAAFPKENHRKTIFSLLSQATGQAITSKDLQESRENPRPHFPGLNLDANWTHSKNICVLAYSFDCQVGIDIEQVQKNRLHIARHFFHPDEVRFIDCQEGSASTSSEELKKQKFYDLWCRKEAYFKCIGGRFFEDSLRVSMLNDSVNGVILKNMDPEKLGIHEKFGLCLAVFPKAI